MRFFNTTGPIRPDKHYSVPPLGRLDLDDVLSLVRNEKYFVLHAPRQTGKTSALLALHDLLNGGVEGDSRCVYANVEAGQAAREDMLREGLEQTADYMDRCAAEASHLVIFDRSEGKSWDEKVFRRRESVGGADILVWGMWRPWHVPFGNAWRRREAARARSLGHVARWIVTARALGE